MNSHNLSNTNRLSLMARYGTAALATALLAACAPSAQNAPVGAQLLGMQSSQSAPYSAVAGALAAPASHITPDNNPTYIFASGACNCVRRYPWPTPFDPDPTSNGSITGLAGPTGIALVGSQLYVPNFNGQSVGVYDASTLSLQYTLSDPGEDPVGVTYAEQGAIIVANAFTTAGAGTPGSISVYLAGNQQNNATPSYVLSDPSLYHVMGIAYHNVPLTGGHCVVSYNDSNSNAHVGGWGTADGNPCQVIPFGEEFADGNAFAGGILFHERPTPMGTMILLDQGVNDGTPGELGFGWLGGTCNTWTESPGSRPVQATFDASYHHFAVANAGHNRIELFRWRANCTPGRAAAPQFTLTHGLTGVNGVAIY